MKREINRVFLEGGEVEDVLKIELKKPGETVRINLIYVGKGRDELKFDYQVVMIAPRTRAEIFGCGILMDEAKKTLRMEIDFRSGCVGAMGQEQEEVMVLSEKASNHSCPIILCSEEEMDGQHGVSVGRIDEEQLEFLKMRGISKKLAEKLLIEAKLRQVLVRMEDEVKRKEVEAEIERLIW